MAQNQNVNAPPAYTVRDAMILCGLDDRELYEGQTPAQRFATDIFSDSFNMCLDKSIEEVNNDIKQYSTLTQNQGRIRITPGNRQAIQAFMQWARDMVRTGREPSLVPFPVQDVATLIREYKSHKAYMEKSKTITEAAKPIKFKETMKWDDWYPTFLNFLKAIPGRNGVPLSYVCRENEQALPHDPNIDYLDNYINQAPLHGDAYTIDAAEVHTYLINFMSNNPTAEVKMLPHAAENNGRLDYRALVEHYEGIGVLGVNVLKAEETLKSLFYIGEKKPAMWWDEFEKQLSHAFTIVHKEQRREVYSNEMKLRILLQKVNADFLQSVKAAMSIELTRVPLLMTYEQALTTFRNEVNRKHPPNMSTNNSRSRRVNEVNNRPNRSGSGRGRGNNNNNNRYNNNNNGGRGRGRGRSRGHPDARFITGTNGRRLEIHASYNFPPEVWNAIPHAERRRINEERQQYRENKRMKVSEVAYVPRNINVQDDARSHTGSAGGSTAPSRAVSESNTDYNGSIMGGRNEQAQLRARNPANRN